jgi:uncharacterized protein YdhG (YjbR/CyaY superfamily)
MSGITDYIERLPDNERAVFLQYDALVREEIPDIEDGWKYGIPTYMYKSQPIFGFASTKKHLSLYPYGNSTIEAFLKDDIAPYVTGGGTLSFQADQPLPDTLVRDIIRVRRAYVEEKLKKK